MAKKPQNMFPSVNRLGSVARARRRVPRTDPRTNSTVAGRRVVGMGTTSSAGGGPARDDGLAAPHPLPLRHRERALRRQEDVHPRAELHQAHALAGGQPLAGSGAGDDPPRQDADDLTEDDRPVTVPQPELGALVPVRGLPAVRGQETALPVRALDHLAPVGRPVDVHVDDGQEDADLLPVPLRRDALLGLAGDHDDAVGGGEHLIRPRRDAVAAPNGVPEEEGHVAGQGQERPGGPGQAPPAAGAARDRGEDRGGQGSGDERPPGPVDAHRGQTVPARVRTAPHVRSGGPGRAGGGRAELGGPAARGPPYQSRQTIVASSLRSPPVAFSTAAPSSWTTSRGCRSALSARAAATSSEAALRSSMPSVRNTIRSPASSGKGWSSKDLPW